MSADFFVFYKKIIPNIPENNIIFIVDNLNLRCINNNNIKINNCFILIKDPVINIFSDKLKIEYIISETIIGFKFFKIYFIRILDLNFLKNLNIKIIIINEGKTTPNVEKIDPNIFPFLNPIKVLIFIAKGPGVDSDIPINSKISFGVAHEYFKI